jgi:GT2 family glycosyltransferase
LGILFVELSIIIVNWNSREYVRKCIRSIYSNLGDVTFEIIVIDSGSGDGCEEMLRSEFAGVHFVQSRDNLGFAGANNLAAASARGDYLLFLNPDTEVLGAAIETMLSAAKTLPGAGAVGCRLLNSDGTLQTSCVQAFPTILGQLLNAEALRRLVPTASLWGMNALFEPTDEPKQVEMISGACLMMRRTVFEQLGGFSTDYFMYAEDMDLCYRAQKHGFPSYLVPHAEVLHHGGGSSQQVANQFASLMMLQSISRFLSKTRGETYSAWYRRSMAFAAVVRLILIIVSAPLMVVVNNTCRWKASAGKWMAILAWSFGISSTTVPASPTRPVTAN